MRPMSFATMCAAVATVMPAVACGVSDVIVHVNGEPDTLAISIVDENSVVVEALTLQVGDTAELSATALNALGQALGSVTPVWSSSDSAVASVSGGVVVGLSVGSADITAQYQTIHATLPVTVTAGPPPPPDAGFTVTESQGATVVHESGTTDEFTVHLHAAPGSNVVLLLAHDDPGEVSHSPPSLTFTNQNWSTPQTVTVTGVDDGLSDGSQVTPLTISVDDDNSHDSYDPVPDAIVYVRTNDDEPAEQQVLFWCDWPTVGSSVAAIRDCTDRDWPRYGSGIQVVADPFDFPTENVIRFTTYSGAGVGFDHTDNMMPTMGLGDTQYVRFYIRYINGEAIETDDNTHGIFTQVADFGAPDMSWDFHEDVGTTWQINHNVDGGPPDNFRISHGNHLTEWFYSSPSIPIHTTVMVETRMEIIQINPDRVRLDTYVTNLAGETISRIENGRMDLGNRARSLNSMFVAFNGYVGATGKPYMMFGGLAICANTWCGPYPIAGVEN